MLGDGLFRGGASRGGVKFEARAGGDGLGACSAALASKRPALAGSCAEEMLWGALPDAADAVGDWSGGSCSGDAGGKAVDVGCSGTVRATCIGSGLPLLLLLLPPPPPPALADG